LWRGEQTGGEQTGERTRGECTLRKKREGKAEKRKKCTEHSERGFQRERFCFVTQENVRETRVDNRREERQRWTRHAQL
jgi:hypothetical protein